ncbi:cyclin-G1 [Hydra vulgaris]|uniref:Cyclin-I n=1 Tax=Hydra vulgaris TaxID=6087 RepID=T2MDD4_HYDVU|nr:cyclin-G1 [Hydra vulgaris]
MLDKLCRDPSHLERLLQWKLLEERNLKVLKFLKLENIHDVEEWKENIYWLMKLTENCGFQCETFALAVHILDSFQGFVKLQGKYLKCATLSAFYIAIKVLEEEEFVPPLSTFVNFTGGKFTENDIKRMEKIILEKTNWDVNHVTICTFLEIFFSFICTLHFKTLFGSDTLAYSIYRNLANQAQQCLCATSLFQFKSSLKALALLSCTLEKITSRWFLYIEKIAACAKIDLQEMLACRDIIKNVIFGQIKKPRVPRLRKFIQRQSLYVSRRSPLSPIVENPFELEMMKRFSDFSKPLETVTECDVLNEELNRLQKICLDDIQQPSPAKRRKILTCGIESKLNACLMSPVKPLPA